MKTSRFFAFMAAVSLAAAFTACDKEENHDDKPAAKSTEAKLLKFDVTGVGTNGEATIEGVVFENEKTIELSYLPETLSALKAATKVEYKISDKATVAPDPTTVKDFTVEGGVKFTVTAEDGTTKVEYTVVAAAAEFQIKTNEIWNKTYGDLGVAVHFTNCCGIAFSGRNFVTADAQVFDLDGNKVGKVNLDGVPTASEANFQFVDMSNDNKGVLVASVGVNASGSIPKDGDDIAESYIFAWLDGWDKAPQAIITFAGESGANICRYLSVAGDFQTAVVVNFPGPQRGATQMYHCYNFKNKDFTQANWQMTTLPYVSSDGCWGQMISFADGDPAGTMFIWDSETPNNGSSFYARPGLNGTPDTALYGTIFTDELVEEEGHAGTNGHQYGNFSYGHARGFKYDGKDYVVASSAGWGASYICIQPADPNEDYLLRSQKYEGSSPQPCSAYYYDSETGHGIVLYAVQPGFEIVRFDIEKEIM